MRIIHLSGAAMALLCVAGPSVAGDFDAALSALAAERLAVYAADPAVIAAIRSQNLQHAATGPEEVNGLDKVWRAQVGAGSAPMIDALLQGPASARLIEIRDSGGGLFTEVIAMDDKGMNVALSDVTSDYWQGDEAKWQQTYLVGPDAVHIGDVELDESTQTYQSQVSITVVDPDTKAPIGALTFGVNVEAL
jgi:hypothetical protein